MSNQNFSKHVFMRSKMDAGSICARVPCCTNTLKGLNFLIIFRLKNMTMILDTKIAYIANEIMGSSSLFGDTELQKLKLSSSLSSSI